LYAAAKESNPTWQSLLKTGFVGRSSLHSKAGTGIRDRIPVLCPPAG
jgi:hypothetical protein